MYNVTRPYNINVRLNTAEYRAIEILSERENISLSSAARSLIQAGYIVEGMVDQLVAEGAITYADPESVTAEQLSGAEMPVRVARREQ